MNSVEVHAQSGSQSQLTDLTPKPAFQDVTADAHIDTSGFEMTSQGLIFAAEKKVDSAILLLNIPETEFRLLSSLLACEERLCRVVLLGHSQKEHQNFSQSQNQWIFQMRHKEKKSLEMQLIRKIF